MQQLKAGDVLCVLFKPINNQILTIKSFSVHMKFPEAKLLIKPESAITD